MRRKEQSGLGCALLCSGLPLLLGAASPEAAHPSAAPTWTLVILLTSLGALVGALVPLVLFFRSVSKESLHERWVNTLLEALPTRILVVDRNGKIHFVLHEDPEQYKFLSQVENFSQFPGGIDKELRTVVLRVLASGDVLSSTYQMNGRQRSGVFRPLPKAFFGEPTVLWVSIDIDDLYRERKDTHRYLERLRVILDSISDGIVAVDSLENITQCNPAAAQMLGGKPEELFGCDLDDIFHLVNARGDAVVSPAKEMLRFDRVVKHSDPLELIAADGTRRQIAVIASPIRDDQNQNSGGVLVLRDITEETRLSRVKNKLADELQYFAEQQEILRLCLERILLEEDSEQLLDEVLSIIGNRIHADRCYIFHNDPVRRMSINTHEWVADGIEPMKDKLQEMVPLDMLPNLWKAFGEQRTVYSADISLPDELQPGGFSDGIEVLRMQNIQSMILAGIWYRKTLWGYVGFDYVKQKKDLTRREENVVAAFARIIEVYLEHRASLDELQQSEYLRRQILENLDIPIQLFDAGSRLVHANPGARRAYRLEEGSATPDRDAVVATIATREPQRFQASLFDRDYIIMTKPILDAGQVLQNVLSSAMDITELKAQQKRLVEAMEAAQAADRAKSYFLATMSHELRTPLNAVIGFSELLLETTPDPAEREDALTSIHLAGKALLELINDVLDLSKLEAEKMDLTPEEVDLGEFFAQIAAIFRQSARSRKLTFELDLSADLPACRLDRKRLRQVLVNLLGNAFKFTHEGSVRLEVRFTPESAESGSLTIRVIDTGIGMSEEGIQSLFTPFKQQNMRDYEGTGLGMAISQRMILRMGGRIEVASTPGKGSTFSVILPGIRCRFTGGDAATRAALPPPPVEPEVKAVPQLPRAFQGKILLVDDVRINLNVLAAMLRKFGIESVLCNSGREALDTVENVKPALILSDLWMPEMNGEELARALKANPATSNIPVVAVTADIMLPPEQKAAFDNVLFKPLTLGKLGELLKCYCN